MPSGNRRLVWPCRSVENGDDLELGLCPRPRKRANHRRFTGVQGMGWNPIFIFKSSSTHLHFSTAKICHTCTPMPMGNLLQTPSVFPVSYHKLGLVGKSRAFFARVFPTTHENQELWGKVYCANCLLDQQHRADDRAEVVRAGVLLEERPFDALGRLTLERQLGRSVHR